MSTKAQAALVATFALASCSPAARSGAPIASRARDVPAENVACAGCHADIAAEWRGSLHRAAHDDATYRAARAREPLAFCDRCHAPEGTSRELASLGVACTTCHPDGHGATVRGDRACARCHEFSFPDRAGSTLHADRMQLTLAERALSRFADTPCDACHMPRVDGPHGPHRAHGFAASRDPTALARALEVRGAIDASGAVEIVLRPGRVGHAFPTGDLFRRLLVGVEVLAPDGERIAFAMQPVGRTFTFRGAHQEQLEDTRPGSPGRPETRIAFPALATGRGRVRYWVDYERVASASGRDVEIEARTRIAEGWIEDER